MNTAYELTREHIYENCISGSHSNLLKTFNKLQSQAHQYDQSYFFNKPFIRQTSGHTSHTTCLLLAVLGRKLSITQFLIERCGSDLEAITSSREHETSDALTYYNLVEGETGNWNLKGPVLWHACRSSSLEIVRCLVQKGARVDSSSGTYAGSTSLM